MSIDHVGDVDGDGVPDVVAGAAGFGSGTIPNLGYAQVISGATGAVIHRLDHFNTIHRYGFAVAGLGDLNNDGIPEFAVSAPSLTTTSPLVSRAGRFWVYSGLDASVLYTITGTQNQEALGTSLCCLDDVDGDGVLDFAAGSEGLIMGSPQTTQAGAVNVYSGATGALIRTINDAIGLGIAIDGVGDLDGDGVGEVLCGLPRSSNFFTNDGAARIYSGQTGALLQSSIGTATSDYYGTSVAGLGDVNGDDIADYLVGASSTLAGSNSQGYVRVLSGADGAVIYTINGSNVGDGFGYNAAAVGDVNGDGYADFGVCALQAQPNHAVIYSGIDGSLLWTIGGLTASSPIGNRICAAGDRNGDGFSDFIVASPAEDVGVFTSAGSVLFFDADTHPILSYTSTKAPSDIILEWMPDGGDINSVTGTIRAIGATPFFSTGVFGSSLAPADFVVSGIPLLIANDAINLVDSGPVAYGFLGEIVVPGISRQNPFIAGSFIHLQLFEFSPVLRSSNGLRWLMVP